MTRHVIVGASLAACATSDTVQLHADDVLVMATKTQDLEAACKTWA